MKNFSKNGSLSILSNGSYSYYFFFFLYIVLESLEIEKFIKNHGYS